jgi:antitoxin MazE
VIQCVYIKEEVEMLKKLVSHGNSAALIIDRPILDLLKVDMDTPLEITTDGKNLIISPVKDEKREKKFKAALERVNKRHGTTLKKLAK